VFICDSSGHLLIFNYVTDDRQGRVADDETFVSDSWTSKYSSDVQGYVAPCFEVMECCYITGTFMTIGVLPVRYSIPSPLPTTLSSPFPSYHVRFPCLIVLGLRKGEQEIGCDGLGRLAE
jgi:hypothetical protein